MSRVGKAPINVPAGASVSIDGNQVMVKGPKGELKQEFSDRIEINREGEQLVVTRRSDNPMDRSLHGLTRTLVYNMVKGVTDGFEKSLEIHGVGYRAILNGKTLELQLGYSMPKKVEAPEGITFEVPVPTKIVVKGSDKQLVGQVAAEIRSLRKPDPYKGKGVRYQGEYIRRKVGKAIK
ncbi:MAG: 50S ribosomal protein L6 [Actinobacteria bacterium]|nr:50S ribosomal protein L6 [Actinomycetota bacterium]